MCVACGQFTGSSRYKTEYVGSTLYKKAKFLNWRGTMTLGSMYNPHITYGPWSYMKGDIGVRGRVEGACGRTPASASHGSGADNQPVGHFEERQVRD